MDERRASNDSQNNLMRNLKLVVSYDGFDFSGWQVQPGAATVQGTLATAIRRLTGEKVLPQGSGRTDAGVHALAQVAHLSIQAPIPPENLVTALNDLLPASVRVLEAREVAFQFHARKSARAKTYQYRIFRGAICPPFLARYVWHFPYVLEEQAMREAAGLIIGEHDFTSFRAAAPERRKDQSKAGNVRIIFTSAWERVGDELVYTVRGNGFLQHMVRNLVGTFILIGKGSRRPHDLPRILRARNRAEAGATAPASGLYLLAVEY